MPGKPYCCRVKRSRPAAGHSLVQIRKAAFDGRIAPALAGHQVANDAPVGLSGELDVSNAAHCVEYVGMARPSAARPMRLLLISVPSMSNRISFISFQAATPRFRPLAAKGFVGRVSGARGADGDATLGQDGFDAAHRAPPSTPSRRLMQRCHARASSYIAGGKGRGSGRRNGSGIAVLRPLMGPSAPRASDPRPRFLVAGQRDAVAGRRR